MATNEGALGFRTALKVACRPTVTGLENVPEGGGSSWPATTCFLAP